MPSPVTEADADPFAALLESFQGRLRAFLLALTGSADAADEVLQNTNQVLWKKRERFQVGSNFKAWSFQIASFEAKAYLRRLSKTRGMEVPAESLVDRIAAAEPAEEGEMAYEMRRQALVGCLGKLEAGDRDLVLRRYFNRTPLSDLSAELGSTQNALAQKLYRLRASLLHCIQNRLSSEATQR